jgi:hypothetical protein
MKRFALLVAAALGIALCGQSAQASWNSSCGYSGYQPWWNIFAHRNKCLTPEEQRLQHFWHDYYDALKNFYGHLDHMDWVAYYKNHGYQINAGCGGGGCGGGNCRINYAPVFVSPQMQWAVPSAALNGPPAGPGMGMGAGMGAGPYGPPPGYGMGGYPPMMGGGYPPAGGPG